MKLTKSTGLRGELSIPGDKSISHRAVMFGSLAKGTTHISNVLSGDASLNKRPMGRIIKPLEQMGAKITSVNGNGCAPLKIEGTKLNATHYDSPVASAQVKSCVLLAGLYADGKTSVTEPALSRNHT